MLQQLNFFSDFLQTTDKAIDMLIEEGILKERKNCNKCNNFSMFLKKRELNNNSKYFYHCNKKTCKTTIGLLKPEYFLKLKIRIEVLLVGIYLFLLNTSNFGVCNMLNITEVTYIKIKSAIIKYIKKKKDESPTIGGPNVEVEVDETVICRSGLIRSPSLADDNIINTLWLLGGIEKNNQRNFFIKIIQNRQTEHLTEVLSQYLKPGTILSTDGYPSYIKTALNLGMEHRIVNHSRGFTTTEGYHTNNIENLWSYLKKERQKKCGIMREKVDEFLVEFWLRKKHLFGYKKEVINDWWIEIIKEFFV